MSVIGLKLVLEKELELLCGEGLRRQRGLGLADVELVDEAGEGWRLEGPDLVQAVGLSHEQLVERDLEDLRARLRTDGEDAVLQVLCIVLCDILQLGAEGLNESRVILFPLGLPC